MAVRTSALFSGMLIKVNTRTRSDGFLGSVLADRLADRCKQLFWLCLGCGKEARAEASDLKYSIANLAQESTPQARFAASVVHTS